MHCRVRGYDYGSDAKDEPEPEVTALSHFKRACEVWDRAGAKSALAECSHEQAQQALTWCCEADNAMGLELVLALEGEKAVDVHASDSAGPEAAFRVACRCGSDQVVRQLLALEGDRRIDVHAKADSQPEGAFRSACEGGAGSTVKLLLELEGDRRIDCSPEGGDAMRVLLENRERRRAGVSMSILEASQAHGLDLTVGDKHGPYAVLRTLLYCYSTRLLSLAFSLPEFARSKLQPPTKIDLDDSLQFRGHRNLDVYLFLVNASGAEEVLSIMPDDRQGWLRESFWIACGQAFVPLVREILKIEQAAGERFLNGTDLANAALSCCRSRAAETLAIVFQLVQERQTHADIKHDNLRYHVFEYGDVEVAREFLFFQRWVASTQPGCEDLVDLGYWIRIATYRGYEGIVRMVLALPECDTAALVKPPEEGDRYDLALLRRDMLWVGEEPLRHSRGALIMKRHQLRKRGFWVMK